MSVMRLAVLAADVVIIGVSRIAVDLTPDEIVIMFREP